ncbi:hypothetical protein GUITHDRAFT_163159 [Guillardia theta CCMP2712]|uniref:Phosphofructokinase domain-containing protein n=1 Tax=Guillardia theta (strain CCMP2712) TaxID=905079 RepID=L1JC57_GUITC|nr:hypothetical protein GUITHDRAFT_163159 [Guillardia theta CCMP2712]EKX45877.1 hypothetical protein GUITHDRAFT_163159 [Guillardia theta CCMP2712]|eukprot:XP_005832857.1 hypothetical protein GUITHDRAFT_163159 [Guillardia theta CCMP2712]
MSDSDIILEKVVLKPDQEGGDCFAFVRAGPRAKIAFLGSETRIGIVTCGGLCPGLNTVIQEIVMTASRQYGVKEGNVLGIRGGFKGFLDPSLQPPVVLTPSSVRDIHNLGGTILGSNRGGFDCEKIVDAIERIKLDQLYVIGGDGTHAAALKLLEEARERKLKVSIIGIPKTIDNDICVIDRSFGFDTAVQEAINAIKSAKTEALSTSNGVGIVKLMGRSSGYLTAHATFGSRDVDVCLIPEIDFDLEGPHGLWSHIRKLLKAQGHAVIAIAEGTQIRSSSSSSKEVKSQSDESVGMQGTKSISEDVGKWFREAVKEAMKHPDRESGGDNESIEISVKYIDPSYMVRSVPANVSDSIYCSLLGSQGVHGAFAGFTGFTVGLVNSRTVYIPMRLISSGTRRLNPKGRTWQRVCAITQQPTFLAQGL